VQRLCWCGYSTLYVREGGQLDLRPARSRAGGLVALTNSQVHWPTRRSSRGTARWWWNTRTAPPARGQLPGSWTLNVNRQRERDQRPDRDTLNLAMPWC